MVKKENPNPSKAEELPEQDRAYYKKKPLVDPKKDNNDGIPQKSAKHNRATIQNCLAHGWKPSKIKKEFGVSYSTIRRWAKRGNITSFQRKRPLRISKDQLEWVRLHTENKETIKDGASCKELAKTFRATFKKRVGKTTMHKYMNLVAAPPRKFQSSTYLTEDQKENRVTFCRSMAEKGVKGEDIFFTDEKRFVFRRHANSSTNFIRLSFENEEKLKIGDPEVLKLVRTEVSKYEESFMVAGGISYNGLSKLIFCVGNVNIFSYRQAIFHYARDVKRLNPNLIFQQDGAKMHTSEKSKSLIRDLFKDYIDVWPANSPDLSPIEMVWNICETELSKKKDYKSILHKKKELIRIWNSFPIDLCRKLINTYNYRSKWVAENGGVNYYQRAKRDKSEEEREKFLYMEDEDFSYDWSKPWNPSLDVENIIYNDDSLHKLREGRIADFEKIIKGLEKKFWKEDGLPYTEKEMKLKAKLYGPTRLNECVAEGERIKKAYWANNIDALLKEIKEMKEMSSIGQFIQKLNNEQRNAATLEDPKYLPSSSNDSQQSTNAEGIIYDEEVELTGLKGLDTYIKESKAPQAKVNNFKSFFDANEKTKKKNTKKK